MTRAHLGQDVRYTGETHTHNDGTTIPTGATGSVCRTITEASTQLKVAVRFDGLGDRRGYWIELENLEPIPAEPAFRAGQRLRYTGPTLAPQAGGVGIGHGTDVTYLRPAAAPGLTEVGIPQLHNLAVLLLTEQLEPITD